MRSIITNIALIGLVCLSTSATGFYCSWTAPKCNGEDQGGAWCRISEDNCRQCGGTVCSSDGPASTPAPATPAPATPAPATPAPATPAPATPAPATPAPATPAPATPAPATPAPATPAPATPAPATPAPATPAPASGGFCSWSKCQGGSQGGTWCNASSDNCIKCGNGAQWCIDTNDNNSNTPAPTSIPATTPAPTPAGGNNGSDNDNESDSDSGNSDSGNADSGTLVATHFWDCSGAACDATVLQPWNPDRYLYSPQYAPVDPALHGGALYGEKIWATGAASDYLTSLMGSDDGCCGSVGEAPGGCGKCVLVRNTNAVNADWSAVVMKKNRCPPWSNGCEAGNAHLDIAVPGYDNLQYSTANTCGAAGTGLSKAQSSVCGAWYNSGSDTTTGCDCSSLPATTADERALKSGCELFTQWGWRSGNPALTYEVVQCPKAFVDIVGAAFDANGPVAAATASARSLRGKK